jgi:hypothetical protein
MGKKRGQSAMMRSLARKRMKINNLGTGALLSYFFLFSFPGKAYC